MSLLRRLRFVFASRSPVPLTGYLISEQPTPFLSMLSDDDMERLNSLLPWQAFTADDRGRRFGNVAWKGKRDTPQPLPDPRITLMDLKFSLCDKSVLEIGCFEGVHTAGLLQFSTNVKAIDARIENVVKTIVRCALLGKQPAVFLCDVERIPADERLLEADFAHHVGVLYHLYDPVRHILDIGRYIKSGIMLDTHYAEPHETTDSYIVDGVQYRYKQYRERGRIDVFSGLSPTSKWLLLKDLIALLQQSGFRKVEVAETRLERNGARALLFASR